MKVMRFMVACCLWVAGITALAQQRPAIIPVPTQMAMGAGEWTLKKNASIGCASAQLRPAARYLQEMLTHATGYKLPIVSKGGTLQLALTNEGKEGSYQLSVDKQGVRITGNTYRGVVYGIATLRQLFDPAIESAEVVAGKQWTIPCLTVLDEPRFEWRGMELDCSRHFFSTDEVKKLLDVLSIYKIDKLHWHLTDDQGWRIEIKRYPLLTEKGAWRTYNNQDSVCIRQAAKEDNPDMQIQASKVKHDTQGREIYGGYYSQDDVRDIVAYAKVRGIEIVPEIDMPGHSLMAILNYDGLACFEQKGWGDVFSTPMCPGKDSMLEFCKNVWSELFDLFPSKYVHLGGDEVEMGNWKKCPHQYWNYAVKKGYSGTAVFTKEEPLSVSYGIGKDEYDVEGRAITVEFKDYYLVNVYTPNSQRDLARLGYRLAWEELLKEYLVGLGEKKPVILTGDLNVSHKEIDLKNSKSNRGNSGFTDEERQKMSDLLESGFVDSFRYLYPDATDKYTWWSYMSKVRERNIGWRIDYFIVQESIADKIKEAKIHSEIMGSDHCPIELEIIL